MTRRTQLSSMGARREWIYPEKSYRQQILGCSCHARFWLISATIISQENELLFVFRVVSPKWLHELLKGILGNLCYSGTAEEISGLSRQSSLGRYASLCSARLLAYIPPTTIPTFEWRRVPSFLTISVLPLKSFIFGWIVVVMSSSFQERRRNAK